MINIGSTVKDHRGKVGILVGYVSGTKPVVMFANESMIYETTNLLKEVKK